MDLQSCSLLGKRLIASRDYFTRSFSARTFFTSTSSHSLSRSCRRLICSCQCHPQTLGCYRNEIDLLDDQFVAGDSCAFYRNRGLLDDSLYDYESLRVLDSGPLDHLFGDLITFGDDGLDRPEASSAGAKLNESHFGALLAHIL